MKMKALLTIALVVSCCVFFLLQLGNKTSQPSLPEQSVVSRTNRSPDDGFRMNGHPADSSRQEIDRPAGEALPKAVRNKHSITDQDRKVFRELSADSTGKTAAID